MKKVLTGFAISLLASLIISGAALAAGGAQTGDRDGTPDRDRDDSCLESIENNSASQLFVRNGKGTGDRDGTPDRDRDDSCLDS